MARGYTDKIPVADLSNGIVTVDEHDDDWYRKYMGGAAMAMDYILHEVPPKADPLGPENVLVFAEGPLTGGRSDGLHVTEEQLEEALDRYYAMAGWDEATGMPTEASLDRYGLDGAVYAPGADPLPHTGGLNLRGQRHRNRVTGCRVDIVTG